MPLVAAHEDPEAPVRDVLWFGTPSVVLEDWTNFTTWLPHGDGYVQEPEERMDRGTWTWFTTAVPARWVVPAGTELLLVVTVSGLEKTWPLPIPLGNASEPFATSFEGESFRLGRGGSGVFASGAVLVPMDPIHPPEGPLRVEVPMRVDEDVVLEEGDRFEVKLHVYTRGVKFNSARVHVGGEETASHVVVPGFPVGAFRAWEEGFPHDLCLWYGMHGEPCPGERFQPQPEPNGAAAADREEVAESPASPVGLLLALLSLALLGRRWRTP